MTTLNERLAPIDALREMLGDDSEVAVWVDAQVECGSAKVAYETARAFTRKTGVKTTKRIDGNHVFYRAEISFGRSPESDWTSRSYVVFTGSLTA